MLSVVMESATRVDIVLENTSNIEERNEMVEMPHSSSDQWGRKVHVVYDELGMV